MRLDLLSAAYYPGPEHAGNMEVGVLLFPVLGSAPRHSRGYIKVLRCRIQARLSLDLILGSLDVVVIKPTAVKHCQHADR